LARIRIGSCSWKYPSWSGLVYSAAKRINYLEEYAERYDTVEIDQWFWSLFGDAAPRLPRAGDVAEYRAAVGDDFRFTLKLPNSLTLTHHYKKKKSDPLVPNPHLLSAELLRAFVDSIEPLHDLLGPMMLQFEYLNRQKISGQEEFQTLLGRFLEQAPAAFTYAVEIRNSRYLNRPFFEFLEQASLAPVLLEGYWMPPVADVFRMYRQQIAAHGTIVVRLHGGDRKEIEEATGKRWDRIVDPRDKELAAVAGMVEELAGGGSDVFVNVNNHYEGCAPLTIERFRKLIRT
jgi:uncharacterized protein YecE (DUF72 family)